MATLQQRLADLITAIGTDHKAQATAIGTLASLSTTAKGSLVAAINEVDANPAVQPLNGVTGLWIGTAAQYAAVSPKVATVVYVVTP